MKRLMALLGSVVLIVICGIAAWLLFSLRESRPEIAGTNAVVANANVVPPATPQRESTPQLAPDANDNARHVEEIAGIGAILKTDPKSGAILIVGTVPNSPAAAAGLAGNLIVRKIDDNPTEGMKLAQCVGLMRGPAGSKVRLELFDTDANEARNVELIRQRIQVAVPDGKAPRLLPEKP